MKYCNKQSNHAPNACSLHQRNTRMFHISTLLSLSLILSRSWDACALPIFTQRPFSAPVNEYDGLKARYDYTEHISHLTMTDGVNISVTFTVPEPHFKGEAFPVLLDYRPYRKDDS